MKKRHLIGPGPSVGLTPTAITIPRITRLTRSVRGSSNRRFFIPIVLMDPQIGKRPQLWDAGPPGGNSQKAGTSVSSG